MAGEIRVGELGEGIDEATFVEWLRSVGDEIAAGDAVAEVMTDKVNVEIEAPGAGVLTALECEPEDRVRVGQVIARYQERVDD